jgi:hypothetical protein
VRFKQHVYAVGPAFAKANVSSDSSTPCEVPMKQTDYRMSDGETIEEALANGAQAKRDWIAAMPAAGSRC